MGNVLLSGFALSRSAVQNMAAAVRTAAILGTAVALVGAGALYAPAAAADVCASTDDCTLNFTKLNSGLTSASFGLVRLTRVGNIVTVAIDMGAGIGIISTGFPNGSSIDYSVAFSDTLGGGLSFGNFTSDSSVYAGGVSNPTKNLQFDGYSDFSNAAAARTNQNGGGGTGTNTPANTLSFTVTKATLTDVEQLLAGSSAIGGPLFVVDVVNAGGTGVTNLAGAFGTTGTGFCANGAPNFPTCSFQQTGVPEPMSMALLGVGLLGLSAVRLRRAA